MRSDLRRAQWYHHQRGGGRLGTWHAVDQQSAGVFPASLLRDMLEVLLLTLAILLPHWLLPNSAALPVDPPVVEVRETIDRNAVQDAAQQIDVLKQRVADIEAQIEEAMQPYRLPIIRSGGGSRPTVRRVATGSS